MDENRHGQNRSPVARAGHLLVNLRRHWEYEVHHRREIIRRNVEFLTAKPGPVDRKDSDHGIAVFPPAVGSEPVASFPSPQKYAASASVTSGIGAPAERSTEEFPAFLTSSSSTVNEPGVSPPSASCAVGEGQNLKPAAPSDEAKIRWMPSPPHRASQKLELPVHSDAATHSSFEVGVLSEHSILELEEEVRRGERRDLVTGEVSSPSTGAETPELMPCTSPAPHPLLTDVRKFFSATGKVLAVVRRLGLPESSMENKLPWHVPPPPFLAKGLEWPPDHFASEQERIQFNRAARKRKKYLMGAPPTWTFMLANVALIAVLVYNPTAR